MEPIKCQERPESSSFILGSDSCRKFSPKLLTPAIRADLIDPTPCFLLAPTTIIFLGFLILTLNFIENIQVFTYKIYVLN